MAHVEDPGRASLLAASRLTGTLPKLKTEPTKPKALFAVGAYSEALYKDPPYSWAYLGLLLG